MQKFYFKDVSNGNILKVSDDCALEMDTTGRAFTLSTAKCPPNLLSLERKQCLFNCDISYVISSATDPSIPANFYWSEKDTTKLLAETYDDVEVSQVNNNFIETSYKEASHLSLQCSATTRQWEFINQDHK